MLNYKTIMAGLLAILSLTTLDSVGHASVDWEKIKNELKSPESSKDRPEEATMAQRSQLRSQLRERTKGTAAECNSYCENNLPHKYTRDLAMSNCKSDCLRCQFLLLRHYKYNVNAIGNEELLRCAQESTMMTEGEKALEKEWDKKQESKSAPPRPSSKAPTTKPGYGRSGGEGR